MNHSGTEVEAKILGATEARLLPRLKELGFEPYFTGELRAQWLLNPANGERLRVRQEGEIIMIEHKTRGQKGSAQIKSLQETGFEARDFDAVIATLGLVGLEKSGFLSIKRRVSYVLDYPSAKQVRLDFDTYSDLIGKTIPEFLEIEATNEAQVYDTAEALGFQRSDCRSYNATELFRHYYPNEAIT